MRIFIAKSQSQGSTGRVTFQFVLEVRVELLPAKVVPAALERGVVVQGRPAQNSPDPKTPVKRQRLRTGSRGGGVIERTVGQGCLRQNDPGRGIRGFANPLVHECGGRN